MSNPQAIGVGFVAQIMEILLAEMNARVAHIPMLAHYTSLDAFKSILRCKELWFSRVTDMSDTSEMTEGGEIVAAALEKFGPQFFKSFCYSETDTRQRFASIRSKIEAETYVLSLCEHGSDQRTDRLTMWRAYGHDGNGLCLVLRKNTLLGQSAAGKFPVHWSPIVYETRSQLEERVLRRLTQIEEVFGKASQGALALLKSALGVMVTGFVLSLVFSHKNEAYDDEREVRFVRSGLLQTSPLPAGQAIAMSVQRRSLRTFLCYPCANTRSFKSTHRCRRYLTTSSSVHRTNRKRCIKR